MCVCVGVFVCVCVCGVNEEVNVRGFPTRLHVEELLIHVGVEESSWPGPAQRRESDV